VLELGKKERKIELERDVEESAVQIWKIGVRSNIQRERENEIKKRENLKKSKVIDRDNKRVKKSYGRERERERERERDLLERSIKGRKGERESFNEA
jgi:hypothetical protein